MRSVTRIRGERERRRKLAARRWEGSGDGKGMERRRKRG